MTDTQTSLLTTTSLTGSDRLRASMTPMERVAGRFMRAPDHGDGDAQGASGVDAGDRGDGAGADGAADANGDAGGEAGDGGEGDKGDDGKSLMNGGGAKEGDEADKVSKDGEDKAEGPPEKYELTPPEGFEIDDKLLAEADPVFRDIGLTGEQANKLMPLVPKFAEALFARQNDAFQAQASDWAKAAKADPEVGGKNWAETETLVAKALDQFAGPKGTADKPNAFRQLLDNTKLGNHPDMIRMFRKIGAQLGEGGNLARSDAAAPVKQDRASLLYPNDVPKTENA